ncbi:MAG: LPS-assembly protein LptD [Alphaproteobacteria bacterium]|nr:LPS-assembly protein LptD [Alphaproteobacteria bacterium]
MKKKYGIFMCCFMVNSFAMANMSVNVDEPKTITADKIEYDLKNAVIKTSGQTEIVNKSGQRMTLTDSYISQNGDSLTGDDIKLWIGDHVYIESANIERTGNTTVARDALFTACDNCDGFGDAWKISTYKIVYKMDARMLRFYSPVLWAYDIPVLWLPYFEMPDPGVKYKTGFLTPDFESTNNMGTQINIPLYVNFSDTHDMTFKLSYLTQENPLFEIDHRLNAEHSEYRTQGSYTYNKAGESRWHIFNDDVIELGDNARATIFLERASDKTYLQKYGFYSDQPYLDSGAKLELFGQSAYAVADMHIFQEMRSEYRGTNTIPSGNILPNIRGVYQTRPLFNETYMTFITDVLGVSGDGSSSQRITGDARIISPWTLWGGNRLTLSLDARYDLYHFDNSDLIDESDFSGFKNRFLPSGYVEWGLPMFRPGDTWTQVIEPRARLTVMRKTDEEQFSLNTDSAGTFLSDSTLFSDNRFSGYDLWENGTFSDYGVRWSAFNNKDGQNAEIFVGQAYDFTDRAATDVNSGYHHGASDYVGRIGYNNNKWLDIASRFRLDRTDLALRHFETSLHIGTNKNFINIGHIYSQQFEETHARMDDINEAVIGAGIQLTNRWALRWNGIYNMTIDEFQRHTGGLFYEHPCYYLSVQYRRDNAVKEDYVGTTTFQFRFGMSIDGQRY